MTIKTIKTLTIITLALFGFVLSAKNCPSIPMVKTPPVIDGNLNDSAWNNVKWTTGFRVLSMPAKKASLQTKFKLVHDNNKLYIAVVLDEPLSNKIKAKAVKRDGAVWRDDCIEIFLDTNNDKSTYFHFGVNAKGTIFDASRRQGGHVSSTRWNSNNAKASTKIEPKKWIVEMSIPLVDLNINRKNCDKWGFNISRSRQAGEHEKSSFVPLNGSFHQPANFAEIKLLDGDLSRYFWKIRPPYEQKSTKTGTKLFYLYKTYVLNETGKFRFVKINSYFTDSPDKAVKTNKGFSENSGKELQLKVPVSGNGDKELIIEISDRRSGDILAKRTFSENINFSPLSIKVTSPAYRDSIYATQKIDSIEGIVYSSLPPEDVKGCNLKIDLINEEGKIVSQEKKSHALMPYKYKISFKNSKTGDYKLIVKIQKNGKVLYLANKVIKKLPRVENEVRINADRITMVNGKPFFPYGWFSITEKKDWKKLADMGYNTMHDYNAYYKSDEDLRKWLDDAEAAGLKVLIYPYPKRSYNDKETWGKPLTEKEAKAIRNFMKKWKNHPALLGWYMADEPELRPALPARMKAIYDVIVDEDPYHPALLLNDSIKGLHTYGKYCDVLMPDPYPLFLKDGDAAQPIEKVGKFVDATNKVPGKGMWITPQGFNYGDFGRKNNREPNFDELRNMQYQAVQNGATGFVWYTYYKSRQYPSCVYGVDFLCREGELLKKVILTPKRKKLDVSGKNQSAFYWSNIDGHKFIIAVNNATSPVTTKIKLPVKATTKWYVVSENRSCISKNGILNDNFKKYDVNIYTTDKKIAGKLNINITEEKCGGKK